MSSAANNDQLIQANAGKSLIQHHAPDLGVEKAMGIGKGNKRLNSAAYDIQEQIDVARDEYLEIVSLWIGPDSQRERYDVPRFGLLGEIVSRTPILVYDLPELKRKVDTAFVDMSGKMYIADTFAARLVAEHERGLDSLFLLFSHEADHLRRLHLSRMIDFPHVIANAAQDVRINIDAVKTMAADRLTPDASGNIDPKKLDEEIMKLLGQLATTAVGTGWAMTYEEHKKYDGMSEEAIAVELLKNWKEPPRVPNREVSFNDIMVGAAAECDGVKDLIVQGAKLAPTPPQYAMTPAELSQLALDLRTIGAAKANPQKVTNQQLQDAYDRLAKAREHQGLVELDLLHTKASMKLAGTGNTHTSGKSGDAYLDALKPSERVELAMSVLEKILKPSANNGVSPDPQNGGLTLKDIERALNGGSGGQPQPGQQSQPGAPGDPSGGGQSGDPDTVPSPNVYHSHDHVMSTEDLVKTLTDAGINPDTLAKLGYDDLKTIEEDKSACKAGLSGAINKATEDMMRVGGRYAGGHLVQYAKAQMADFFKPRLTWQMKVKKMLEEVGRGQRHDIMEPWIISSVDPADMGFKSARDVPYQGSMVPGKQQKPLIVNLYDTSGSVDDAMLKSFFSEGVNMSKKVSRGNAPDTVHISADTVGRGEPVYITEKNYRQVLLNGIEYGGRGGTNFQASIEHAFEMVNSSNLKSAFKGRQIDCLVYFTDTGDYPPDPKRLMAKARAVGMKRMPTILFVAPKQCYDKSFNDGIKGWADIVYYDAGPNYVHRDSNKQLIDVDKIARDQEARRKLTIGDSKP